MQVAISCLKSVAASSTGILKARDVMAILDEIVECLDVDECLKLFNWIEIECSTWLIEIISTLNPKMRFGLFQSLLRRFNPYVDQGAEAQGRLRNFLARVCPPSNITGRNDKGDVNDRWALSYKKDIADTEVISQPGDPVIIKGDYYKNLWSLVETLHNPDAGRVLVSRPGGILDWQRMQRKFDHVLRIFEASVKRLSEAYDIRQESERSERRPGKRSVSDGPLADLSDDNFFLHYLTDPHLLPLETMDPQFRKQVLSQMFIFLHALLTPGIKSFLENKPKTDEAVPLDAKIVQQVNEILKRVRAQITSTPTAGKRFLGQLHVMLGTFAGSYNF